MQGNTLRKRRHKRESLSENQNQAGARMIGVERLKEIELSRDLTTDELEVMSQICEVKTYEASSVIFKEGDEGKEMYVVDEGMVNCMIHPTPDQPVVVGTKTRNSLFGWSAMISPHRYTATAKAAEKTRVFVARGSDLRRICGVNPHICSKVMEKIVCIVDDQLVKTRQALIQAFYESHGR